MPLFFFILIAALVIFLIIQGAKQAKKRQADLVAWAEARQFQFSPDHDRTFDDRFAEFSSLRQGRNRYAYNISDGEYRGRFLTAFDYHYETESTDSKGNTETTHHHFSAVVIEAGVPLKPLSIRPEGFFDKIGEFLGFDDIDFESAEFSRTFYVKSPDRRWAFDVLHQRTMEMLLEAPRFTIEFQPGRVLIWRGGVLAADDFQAALDVVTHLLDLIPAAVLEDLREGR